MAELKAYRITITQWKDFELVYPGMTRGKAIAQACIASDLVGFAIKFTDFRARRDPQFDNLAQETKGKYPWCLGWRDDGEE